MGFPTSLPRCSADSNLHLARTAGCFSLPITNPIGRRSASTFALTAHHAAQRLADPQQRRARVQAMPSREVERVPIQLMPACVAAQP